jgi:outer membrane scaffolding protein for murein synthesis (MipA/OmpV family)
MLPGLVLIALAVTLPLRSQADEPTEKKWELGMGLGSVYGPDYRGADEYRGFTSAIPYLVYRGKFIRADREGVRAQFFDSDRFAFSISASAYISPDSDENQARQGMPALGSTLELGPSINIRLSGENLREGWQLQLPWRAVFAIGGDTNKLIGSVIQPQLVYQHAFSQWRLRYTTGVIYGSNSYHDYYYSVAPRYATLDRPEYDAQGGYSGYVNNLSLSRQLDLGTFNTRVAFFSRYDNLDGVDFDKSPLYQTPHVWRAGVAFIWVIR